MAAKTSIRVRRGRPDDAPALAEIERRCFHGPYAAHRWDEDTIAARLVHPRACVLVAESGGEIAGYLAGYLRGGATSHVARIDSIAVLGRYRRRGVGERLLRRFFREAGTARKVITLEVSGDNSPARRLFAAEGFEEIRRLRDHYGLGADAIRMSRRRQLS